MLTEQTAYSNRWRTVSPAAKGCFSLSALVAAFVASSPRMNLLTALLLIAITTMGAGVPLWRYLRIALPTLLFLLVSTATLAFSVSFSMSSLTLSLQPATAELPRVALVCSRSLASLTALLFLGLTTPLNDIIGLLRRCRVPALLLDLMTLCYRTLFVLSETVHQTMTAQSARLGYGGLRRSFRSLGCLIAGLTIQIWQRSEALHRAALARNNDGALRFLEAEFPDAPRAITCAILAGISLIFLAATIP